MELLYFLVFIFLIYYSVLNFKFYKETVQDLNLEKDFKEKKHRVYEICSVCGKKLKHARFWELGDVMMCSVECKGKTTWYCQDCGEKYLDNAPSVNPEDYVGGQND